MTVEEPRTVPIPSIEEVEEEKKRHFGNLKNLEPGDSVTVTDILGNVFEYEVDEVLILQPTAVEEMISGDWDLTLFTCTLGGQTRVTVRCTLVKDEND